MGSDLTIPQSQIRLWYEYRHFGINKSGLYLAIRYRFMEHMVYGQLVDLHERRIYPAEIRIQGKRIAGITPVDEAPGQFILPGFVDSHIHIESSMLVPYEFAKTALCYGTVATVSDPHEIANVLGVAGVQYMLDNAKGAGLKFFFGAPSCVPATSFETAGARLGVKEVKRLLEREEIRYLAEMMNYPGVLNRDSEVMAKIECAKVLGKPIDGHAPGLKGSQAAKYIGAGMSTDHECFTLEEALDKLGYGMKISIREGSAAKNYEALHTLISSHTESVMFCSDDKHPDELLKGHIDVLIRRSLALGYDLFDVLRIACINPVLHYRLPVGLLRPGDPADFIVVKDLEGFEVDELYINGRKVVSSNRANLPERSHSIVNRFSTGRKKPSDFVYSGPVNPIPVIKAVEGQLITTKEWLENFSDLEKQDREIQKIAVVNRYEEHPPATGYIKGFSLEKGALASSVAHDSHNIVAIGTSDEAICRAINLVIDHRGGLSAVADAEEHVLPLPIAGLMSPLTITSVAAKYEALNVAAASMGCGMKAPFMTLSFMALLVIPEIKMSDLGIFDAQAFRFF